MTSSLILIILVLALSAYLKSAQLKGKLGESIVNIKSSLSQDNNVYTILKDMTFKLDDGNTTQIDHVIISKFGVFVIETKNIKALENILNIPETSFNSIITFVGDCTFKTDLPPTVFKGLKYIDYIKSFQTVVFNPAQVRLMTSKLNKVKMTPGKVTNKEHIQNLKKVHG